MCTFLPPYLSVCLARVLSLSLSRLFLCLSISVLCLCVVHCISRLHLPAPLCLALSLSLSVSLRPALFPSILSLCFSLSLFTCVRVVSEQKYAHVLDANLCTSSGGTQAMSEDPKFTKSLWGRTFTGVLLASLCCGSSCRHKKRPSNVLHSGWWFRYCAASWSARVVLVCHAHASQLFVTRVCGRVRRMQQMVLILDDITAEVKLWIRLHLPKYVRSPLPSRVVTRVRLFSAIRVCRSEVHEARCSMRRGSLAGLVFHAPQDHVWSHGLFRGQETNSRCAKKTMCCCLCACVPGTHWGASIACV
jgi:hypothetical protein